MSGNETFVAGALQLDVRRGDVDANVRAAADGVDRAAAAGVRLLVLPEMWPTSFVDPADPCGDWRPATERGLEVLRDRSRRHDMVIAGSSFGFGDDARPANRLHVFDRGELVLSYDKVHLFSPTAEGESFTAGDAPPSTVATSVGRVSGVVCYDLRFGELTGVPARDQVDVLVVPAQWPAPRSAHWRALVIGRAVEDQCWVVGANRVGVDVVGRRELELEFPGGSLIVDPHGVVAAEGDGEAGLVRAEVDVERARRLRVRVPIAKDRRPGLYRGWGLAPPRGGS